MKANYLTLELAGITSISEHEYRGINWYLWPGGRQNHFQLVRTAFRREHIKIPQLKNLQCLNRQQTLQKLNTFHLTNSKMLMCWCKYFCLDYDLSFCGDGGSRHQTNICFLLFIWPSILWKTWVGLNFVLCNNNILPYSTNLRAGRWGRPLLREILIVFTLISTSSLRITSSWTTQEWHRLV